MTMLSLARYFLGSRLHRDSADYPRTFIDVHSHFLPDFYVEAMRGAGIHDVDGWPVPRWSAQDALNMMKDNDIAAQVLSLSSPGITFAKGQQARDLARSLNCFLAQTIEEHAPRFGGFAVVPLPDIEASLDEIGYALDTLKLDGVGLLTNYDGIYLGDPLLDPVFAELNRRNAVVFVHPTQPPNFKPLSVGLPAPILEYPFDTTRMVKNLVKSGTLRKYPDIRIIAAHGGGTIPYLFPRIVTGTGLNTADDYSRLYYDMTATTAPPQTQALRSVASPDRMLIGFDFPFMDVKTVKPIIAGLHLSNFSSSRIFDIQRGTAQRLFPRIAASLNEGN